MSCIRNDVLVNMLSLYGVTDRQPEVSADHLVQMTAAAVSGGVTIVQLREKNISPDTYLALARCIASVCRNYTVPFIINDDVSVALACNADGVHVGQNDMNVESARKAMGPGKILGVSVQTVEDAVYAASAGADYLGVGAVFPTKTKNDAVSVSWETLELICRSVSIPVVAIGGITAKNCSELVQTGIAGIAVSSALFHTDDPASAARAFAGPCELIRSTWYQRQERV